MPSVEVQGFHELDQALNTILKEISGVRQELHDRLSKMLKEEVDRSIDQSGLNDSHNKIKNWQEERVGSKGGYAAIRPKKGPGLVGPNSPGAITNYLEHGHKGRPSRKQAQELQGMKEARRREVQRRTKGGRFARKTTVVLDTRKWVPGYFFYADARKQVESKAIEIAEKFVDEFAKKLEG